MSQDQVQRFFSSDPNHLQKTLLPKKTKSPSVSHPFLTSTLSSRSRIPTTTLIPLPKVLSLSARPRVVESTGPRVPYEDAHPVPDQVYVSSRGLGRPRSTLIGPTHPLGQPKGSTSTPYSRARARDPRRADRPRAIPLALPDPSRDLVLSAGAPPPRQSAKSTPEIRLRRGSTPETPGRTPGQAGPRPPIHPARQVDHRVGPDEQEQSVELGPGCELHVAGFRALGRPEPGSRGQEVPVELP